MGFFVLGHFFGDFGDFVPWGGSHLSKEQPQVYIIG